MRKLNKKQKDYLIWRYKEGVRSYNDLSLGQQEVLDEMNLHEDLIGNVDRFLTDLHFKGGY